MHLNFKFYHKRAIQTFSIKLMKGIALYTCMSTLSMGLSRTQIMTSSQLAWQLNWKSTVPPLHRPGFVFRSGLNFQAFFCYSLSSSAKLRRSLTLKINTDTYSPSILRKDNYMNSVPEQRKIMWNQNLPNLFVHYMLCIFINGGQWIFPVFAQTILIRLNLGHRWLSWLNNVLSCRRLWVWLRLDQHSGS